MSWMKLSAWWQAVQGSSQADQVASYLLKPLFGRPDFRRSLFKKRMEKCSWRRNCFVFFKASFSRMKIRWWFQVLRFEHLKRRVSMCSPMVVFGRTGKQARNEPMSSAKKDAILKPESQKLRKQWSLPSLKLTVRPWQWMVGILVSFWEALVSGANC